MSKKSVYVGVSGGVDSAVTLALISKKYKTRGIFMRNWSKDLPGFQCPWREDWHDAQSVALSLNLPIELWDFEKDYRNKVVDYLVSEYRAGRTPNPDIICNQEIKFKVFLEHAFELGADKISTGHYARIHQDEKKRFWLQMAKDETKDQTYFLARISQKALSKSLFPLGDLKKSDVRELATKLNLPVADKKDSVGICFVGEVGITDFLKNFIDLKTGPIIDIDTNNEIGQHEGSELYTIGQRHGLDLKTSADLPYYVVKKDTNKNIVYVSSDLNSTDLWVNKITLTDVHLPTINENEINDYKNLTLRYRHLGKLENIHTLLKSGAKEYIIELKEKIKKPASGQTGVIYTDNQCVLLAGFIK
ncbi:MAG: tRNA 2-thiouridine(34) synthase MnmA [Candidatus Nomurabacteria bacterium]|mgnify:CR=1 FL=1|nr:MAG: tRNA 2-thiouridine(34) synthase MnmA [Candidatus Nomurabacteria bacterium]HRV75967.1 tRNA 2-thiouridine(34) synthase MnmA [Candidatus Saccharimonadales bacterium]